MKKPDILVPGCALYGINTTHLHVGFARKVINLRYHDSNGHLSSKLKSCLSVCLSVCHDDQARGLSSYSHSSGLSAGWGGGGGEGLGGSAINPNQWDGEKVIFTSQ